MRVRDCVSGLTVGAQLTLKNQQTSKTSEIIFFYLLLKIPCNIIITFFLLFIIINISSLIYIFHHIVWFIFFDGYGNFVTYETKLIL